MGICRSVCAPEEGESSTQAEVPRRHMRKEIPEAQETTEIVAVGDLCSLPKADLGPGYSPAQVLLLQSYFRAYRAGKETKRRGETELEWSDDEEIPSPTQAGVSNLDPESRLSEVVKEVLAHKPPFPYSRSIREAQDCGVRLFPDGSVYIGQWSVKDGSLQCRKGRGRIYNSNGSYAEGYWKAGKLHLFARFIASNGDFYEGGFRLGLREGIGVSESFTGGLVYQGSWKADRRHGKGLEKYSDGAIYEGDFLSDQKTGTGVTRYTDGSWYQGQFVNGEFEGVGEYCWADGRHYVGQWTCSKMHGKGRFTYKDGKMYEGSYVEGRKEGYGVYTWEGKKYEGGWKDGKMHGQGWITSEKGRRQYEFRDGDRVSEV